MELSKQPFGRSGDGEASAGESKRKDSERQAGRRTRVHAQV